MPPEKKLNSHAKLRIKNSQIRMEIKDGRTHVIFQYPTVLPIAEDELNHIYRSIRSERGSRRGYFAVTGQYES